VAPHDRQRLQQRAQQLERRDQQCHYALAPQSADRQPLDRNALLGHDAGLEPAAGSKPYDFARIRAQQSRQRERREHVPAGSPRHDQHRTRAHFDMLAEPRAATMAS
jgi:hypothetical protein